MVDAPIFEPFQVAVKHLVLDRPPSFVLGPLTQKFMSPGLVYIEGGNGIGKTTLLRAMAGLFTPDQGTVQVTPGIRRMLTDHKRGLLLELTVNDHLIFWQKLYGASALQVRDALAYFQLTPFLERRTKYLSEGQRQRLSLTRLLLGNAPLWFLDEPLSALDKEGAELLSKMVEMHVKKGGLVIMATHLRLSLKNFQTFELQEGRHRPKGAHL